MANASPKPCAHPACPALVYDNIGWCAKHIPVEGKFADRRRGSRHERGYGSAWGKLRRLILERDNYLCRVCLSAGRISKANEVDHVVPKAAGGSDDETNLQSICERCHKAKTAREGGRR